LKSTLFIAFRLIKSKKLKFFSLTTNIALIGIAISITVLILAFQILDGFEKSIYDFSSSIDSQIKITAYGNQSIEKNNLIRQRVTNTIGNQLESMEKFIAKYAVIKSKYNSDGALVIGLNNGKTLEHLSSFIINKKQRNSNFTIIGKKLAEKLNVTIGDKITFFALQNDEVSTFDNPPNIEQLRVTGIFETGMPYYDGDFVFISYPNAENLFAMNNKITGYNVFLKTNDENTIEKLSAKLRDKLPYPYYVRSVFSIHRNIFVWLDLQKKPIPIVLSAIVLVAMLNIIGALFLLVLKRKRTIGILRTLGFPLKKVRLIFLLQGAFISFSGIFLGVLISLIVTYLQNNYQLISLPGNIYFMDKLIISTKIIYYLLIPVFSFATGILISLLPANFGAKISPVNAIRNV